MCDSTGSYTEWFDFGGAHDWGTRAARAVWGSGFGAAAAGAAVRWAAGLVAGAVRAEAGAGAGAAGLVTGTVLAAGVLAAPPASLCTGRSGAGHKNIGSSSAHWPGQSISNQEVVTS